MRWTDFLADGDAKPQGGVYLRLTHRATGESHITKTRTDGRFTVDLPAGEYRMEKSGAGERWLDVGFDWNLPR